MPGRTPRFLLWTRNRVRIRSTPTISLTTGLAANLSVLLTTHISVRISGISACSPRSGGPDHAVPLQGDRFQQGDPSRARIRAE